MKAKTMSLIAKIVAVIYALSASMVFKIEATQVVIIAVFIAEAFVTVDISMITRNVKGK